MASFVEGTAFITGAASGIGYAAANAFAQHGISNLALSDINMKALDEAVAALKVAYPKVNMIGLKVDVRSAEQIKEGLAETVKTFGRLDIAVNNAGIGGTGKLTHETDYEEIERVLDIDLHGVYRCQKEELQILVNQEDLGPKLGRGRIINVASMYGLVAPRAPIAATAYTTAKHGVVGLTKSDANTYAGHGIRINAICPGYVETPLLMESLKTVPTGDSMYNDMVTQTPVGRLCTMEEIGHAISWLASPLNSFMQGAVLTVDGGWTSN